MQGCVHGQSLDNNGIRTLYARRPGWARMGILVRHLPVVKFLAPALALALAVFYRDHPPLAQRRGGTQPTDGPAGPVWGGH
jgi:hypothetical protein